ncbi:hypothetical protein [Streptomyces sp. NPDC048611]|uniref:hypothetical protein n=1 Tax=Streptomyces sp. NPDC048611 TaxID=3155635 RepID=UPI003447E524
MPDRPTAGSRVRIVIEDTVESMNSGTLRTTGGVYIESLGQPGALTLQVLEPGWQVGDIVHDGRDQLVRIDRGDGVHVWQRPNGYVTYDDETDLASLRVIRPATP